MVPEAQEQPMTWTFQSYQSGTMAITSDRGGAHYAVIGTKRVEDSHAGQVYIAAAICEWLNGGRRPDLGRATHWTAEQVALQSGFRIEARGPHYETEPGNGCWRISMEPEHIAERAAMTLKLLEAINE
jgi:hypothetical protein